MTAVKWHEGTITGLDTETTSVDPHTARIVTASVVHRIPGQRPKTIDWVIDPGIDIPPEAAAVHGWTRDRLRTHIGLPDHALRISGGQATRMTRQGALAEIAAKVATTIHVGTPLVIANAPYDASLLDAELVRHGLEPVQSRQAGWVGVVDPMVIDHSWDPYRRSCYKAPGCRPLDDHHECCGCQGPKRSKYDCGACGVKNRKLTSLCKHYGIVLANAHSSSADALAAVRLAVKLAQLDTNETGRYLLGTLHRKQAEWHHRRITEWRASKQRKGESTDDMCPEWPIHTVCAPAATEAVA